MPTAFVSPGLYIREVDESLFVPSLAATPLGAVGLATWGPINEPTLVTSQSQLFWKFGPLTGASSYSEATDQYPDHPMMYALDRYLRRGRQAMVARVGDADTLKQAEAFLPGESNIRTAPATNTTFPPVANPTSAGSISQSDETAGALTVLSTVVTAYTFENSNGETKLSPEDSTTLTGTNDTVTLAAISGIDSSVTKVNAYIKNSDGVFVFAGSGAVTSGTSATIQILSIPTNSFPHLVSYRAKAKYYGTLGNRLRVTVAEGGNSLPGTPTKKIFVSLASPIDANKVQQVEVFDGVVTDRTDTTDDAEVRISETVSDYLYLTKNVPSSDTSGLASGDLPTTSHFSAAEAAISGGGFAVANGYQVAISFSTATGETLVSGATTVNVTGTGSPATNSITIAKGDAAPTGTTHVNVYVSTSASVALTLVASIPLADWDNSTPVNLKLSSDILPVISTTPVSLSKGHDGDKTSAGADIAASIYQGVPADSVTAATGLELFTNPEAVAVNMLAVPGISDSSVVAKLIDVCETRKDCLALVDPKSDLSADGVIKWHNGVSGLTGAPSTALNSSYAALFWPWVQVNDALNEQKLFIPPSAIAAETIANNDFIAEPWYAPAGLTRGQVRNVLKAQYQPTLGERDALYTQGNAVNPIATFAASGIVVWGQRTMQREPTALDRINVRRLLIILRGAVDRAARSLVFEPNDATMWRKFKNLLNPLLEGVKARRGIVDFEVVMDSTTNPPDIIEQNMAIGDIFIKPTKSAEMVVLNFIVTSQSSTFNETTVSDAV